MANFLEVEIETNEEDEGIVEYKLLWISLLEEIEKLDNEDFMKPKYEWNRNLKRRVIRVYNSISNVRLLGDSESRFHGKLILVFPTFITLFPALVNSIMTITANANIKFYVVRDSLVTNSAIERMLVRQTTEIEQMLRRFTISSPITYNPQDQYMTFLQHLSTEEAKNQDQISLYLE